MNPIRKPHLLVPSLLATALQTALAASTIALPDTAPNYNTGTIKNSPDNYVRTFNDCADIYGTPQSVCTDGEYIDYNVLKKWYAIDYGATAKAGDITRVTPPWSSAPANKAIRFAPLSLNADGGGVQYILPLNLKLNTRYRIRLVMGTDNTPGTTTQVDLASIVVSHLHYIDEKGQTVDKDVQPSSITRTVDLQAGTPTEVIIEGIVTTPDGVVAPGDRSLRLFPKKAGVPIYIDNMSVEEVNTNPLNMAEDKAFGKPSAATPLLMDRKMFGLHINELGSHNGWTNLGQEVLRLWGTDESYWFAIQPTADPNTANWNWRGLNYRVGFFLQGSTTDPKLNHAPNGDIIYTLGQTPRWATDYANIDGSPADCSYHYATANASGNTIDFGACAAPSTLAAFKAYVTGVATKYKDQIKYFEIWNEPATGNFYQGSPEWMAQLTEQAKLALTAVNAGQKLVGPAADGAWMDRYLKAGAGKHIDIYNFHGYITPYRVETDLVAAVANVKLKMAEYGLGAKPIWNTESGASCGQDGSSCAGIRPALTSTQWLLDQQGLIPRSLAVQWANGVSNMDYFFLEGWDEGWSALVSRPPNGVKNPDGSISYPCNQQPQGAPYYCTGLMPATPLGKGYSKAAEWLKGTKLYSAYKMADQDIYIFKLRTATGAQRYLVWNASTSTKQVSAPLPWNIKTVSYIDPGMITKTLSYSIQPFTLEPRYPVLLAP